MSIPTDRIIEATRTVLRDAAGDKGARPHFLTTYQLLDRFPQELHDALVAAYGPYGRGSGNYYTAASRVAKVVSGLADVDVQFLDAQGLTFDQEGEEGVRSGYPVVGIYRLK